MHFERQGVVVLAAAFLFCLQLSSFAGGGTGISLGNGSLTLNFDPSDGSLTEMAGADGTKIAPSRKTQLNLQDANGKWIFPENGESPFKLDSYKASENGGDKLLKLFLSAPGWRVELRYKLFAGAPLFSRSAVWTRVADEVLKTKVFRSSLGAPAIGAPEDCVVTHPGVWPPSTKRLTEGFGTMSSSQTNAHMPGAVLYDERLKTGLSLTMRTRKSDFSIVSRRSGSGVDIDSEFNARAPMKKGDSIETGEELVSVTKGAIEDAFSALGGSWLKSGFVPRKRPEWTDGTVIYSAFPQGSAYSRYMDIGGFKNFQAHLLPHLKRLGVGILWLNPFNDGRYGVRSYYDLEPEAGTEADLKDLCDGAHSEGMRVLMDLIPHGPKDDKPYGQWVLKERPEWVSRNPDGTPKYWWGGLSMDYASPGWQGEMAKLATYYVDKCGVDGWRVDCARYSPDNDRPTDGRAPYQSGTEGALELMKRVHAALDAKKDACVLLGETCTASHLEEMDFIYDTQMGSEVFQASRYVKPEAWVPQFKSYLSRDQAATPLELRSGLMHYLENHDIPFGRWRYGNGHAAALLSTCFLIPGVPLLNNDQDIGNGELIAKLSEIRRRPEFVKGEALYKETGSSEPEVLTFARVLAGRFSIVAINFAGVEKTVKAVLPPSCAKDVASKRLGGTELFTGASAETDGKSLRFSIIPYATRVFAFGPRIGTEASPASPAQAAKPLSKPLKVEETESSIAVENAYWSVKFANGFLVSLRDASGREFIAGSELVEGPYPSWLDVKPGSGAAPARLERKIEREDGSLVLGFSGEWLAAGGARIPWKSVYEMNDGAEIGVRFEMLSPEGTAPLSLSLETSFSPKLDEWYVAGLEGALRDKISTTHPLGDEFVMKSSGKWPKEFRVMYFDQPCGMFWQAAGTPLDPDIRQVAVGGSGRWLGFRLPDDPLASLGNIYLRERGAARESMTLRFAFFEDAKRARPGTSATAAFTLRVGDEPEFRRAPLTGDGWRMLNESSALRFENGSYELSASRALGGEIRELSIPGNKRPLIAKSEISSKDGFFKKAFDAESWGSSQNYGSSAENPETSLRLGRSGAALECVFTGNLKTSKSHWIYDAMPRVAYEIAYRLDKSKSAKLRIGVFPAPREELEGSLSWSCAIPAAKSVEIHRGGRSESISLDRSVKNKRLLSIPPSSLDGEARIVVVRDDGARWAFHKMDASQLQNILFESDKNGDLRFAAVFYEAAKTKSERMEPKDRSFSFEIETP